MGYERQGVYSLPFTVVNNKVSEVLNWGIGNMETFPIYLTRGGNFVYSDGNHWHRPDGSSFNYESFDTVGIAGYLHYHEWTVIRARVYDPIVTRKDRCEVKISSNDKKYYPILDRVFEELDRMERMMFGHY